MAHLGSSAILRHSSGLALTSQPISYCILPQKMAFAAEETQEGNVVLYIVVGLYLVLLTAIAKLAHSRKQKAAAAVGHVQARGFSVYRCPS